MTLGTPKWTITGTQYLAYCNNFTELLRRIIQLICLKFIHNFSGCCFLNRKKVKRKRYFVLFLFLSSFFTFSVSYSRTLGLRNLLNLITWLWKNNVKMTSGLVQHLISSWYPISQWGSSYITSMMTPQRNKKIVVEHKMVNRCLTGNLWGLRIVSIMFYQILLSYHYHFWIRYATDKICACCLSCSSSLQYLSCWLTCWMPLYETAYWPTLDKGNHESSTCCFLSIAAWVMAVCNGAYVDSDDSEENTWGTEKHWIQCNKGA